MSLSGSHTGGDGEAPLPTPSVADFFRSRQDIIEYKNRNLHQSLLGLSNKDLEDYLHTKDIQSTYPHQDIREAFTMLIDGVRAGIDNKLTEISGQDVKGLISRKKFNTGEKIGIYSGVVINDFRDNAYLLEITHTSGKYVLDGTPSTDRWTVFSYANEWIWDPNRNNAECLSGGILTATRIILPGESIYWNYGEDYPWWQVILPLFHHIPWHLNNVAKFLGTKGYDDDIRSLSEATSSMDELTFQGILTHPECKFFYALAVYSCGHEQERNI